MNILEKLNSIPSKSGVYLFKDKEGNIIYVGKSACLKDRIKSYFSESGRYDLKVSAMISQIKDFAYLTTSNEIEALILENKLIKKYKPKYNILFKDDKTYPYIKIYSNEEFPHLSFTRRILPDKAMYFGPYVIGSVREIIKIIQKQFKIRDCSISLDKKLKRGCLKEQTDFCSAPCMGKITKEEYKKIVKEVIEFLKGKQKNLINKLEEKMKKASNSLQFEDASLYRDQKNLVKLIQSQNEKNVKLCNMAKEESKLIEVKKAETNLRDILNLTKEPKIIEGIDISNIFGDKATGSVVRFKNGKPDKNGYRKFKIKEITGINDTEMIKEVVERRYRRAIEEKTLPDLILIDGGKGQLNSAIFVLKKLDLSIPVISIAKKNEEIFISEKLESLKLPKNSSSLHLLQYVRDEAHRFAIKYHKILRDKEIKKSILDEIPGIGKKEKP
ncbi:MAG: excinuclease ABC subunit UvrC [Candidatus Firestonebacteria bacterium]